MGFGIMVVTVMGTRRLPSEATPNSRYDLYRPGQGRVQSRWYGHDGRATRNRDYRHGGTGHTFPHDHVWDWSSGIGERGNH